MARSGPGAGEPPVAITAQGSSGSAPRPGTSGRGSKAALGLVALGLVGHVLRSRRFYEGVAVAVIALGALRGIGQENQASTMARLSAWNKREMQRLEHNAERQMRRVERKAKRQMRRVKRKAKRQAAAVKGGRRMARSGRPRGLAAVSDAAADGGRKA